MERFKLPVGLWRRSTLFHINVYDRYSSKQDFIVIHYIEVALVKYAFGILPKIYPHVLVSKPDFPCILVVPGILSRDVLESVWNKC